MERNRANSHCYLPISGVNAAFAALVCWAEAAVSAAFAADVCWEKALRFCTQECDRLVQHAWGKESSIFDLVLMVTWFYYEVRSVKDNPNIHRRSMKESFTESHVTEIWQHFLTCASSNERPPSGASWMKLQLKNPAYNISNSALCCDY